MINAEHEGRKILHICCKSDSELPRNQKKKGGGGEDNQKPVAQRSISKFLCPKKLYSVHSVEKYHA